MDQVGLLGALVDLTEEDGEDVLLEHGRVRRPVWELLDERGNLVVRLLLVRFKLGLDIDIGRSEHGLDLGLGRGILSAIVGIEDRALLRRHMRKRSVNHPAALVVLDIRANLTEHFGRRICIEVVVLNLKVLAKWQ